MAFNIGIFVLFLLALYVSKMLSSGSLREAMAKRFESPPVLTARWNVPGTVKFYIGLLRAAGTGKVHVFMKSIFSTASEGCGYEVKTVLLGRPWGYRILTCDTENIHAVLTTKFQDFSTGSRKQALEPGLGRHSIFGSDGEAWKKSRHYIRSALSRERISDTSVVHRNTASLISVLATTPGPIDVQPLFLEHAMRTSTEFLGIGSSESNEAWDDRGFSQAVEVANLGITKRVSLDSFYWLYDTTAFRRACKLAHNVVMTSVRKVLASEEDMGEHGRSQFPQKEKRNLLEELVTETRDEERLLSMALDVLSASRQTTTSLLSSLVYYLAQHPTTYSKLRSEIVQTFGAVETDTLMTFEQLKRCQYLQWCINETLRLVPPAPFGAMTAAVDTILPTGGGAGGKSPIFVKKGTVVGWDLVLLHTDWKNWGADAYDWRPERFADRGSTWKGYLPFSAGARTCPGQQFALTNAAYALVRICQKFVHIESFDEPGRERRMTFGLAQLHMDGVKVRFT